MKKHLTASQRSALVAVLIACLHFGCDEDEIKTFVIRSSAFGEKETMPSQFACGAGISPPLSFSRVPSEVKGLAVIAEDLDRLSGAYTQWMMWNLPSKVMITEDVESFPIEDAVMGTADDGKTVGYLAPCPPKGEAHRIVFRAYGLDAPLGLGEGATRATFDDRVNKHKIAEASLTAKAVGK